jgi:radical SAM protein with 4Fe4S-binding SPASM domain
MEFPQLKALADQFGFDKLTRAFCKLEALPGKKRENACRRVKFLLCEQEYEPLWRQIFEKIKASQAQYPQKTDHCCYGELLNQKRSAIQKIMESHGFLGEYPNFQMRGPISGLHLESSYNQSYFVAGEKNVISHVHCIEGCDCDGSPVFQFLCGIEFLRKDEQPGDIYSCLDIQRRPELVQGNVYRDDFMDIWYNRFREFRRDRTDDCEDCRSCADRRFCRGDAAHTWDYEKKQPLLCPKQLWANREDGL